MQPQDPSVLGLKTDPKRQQEYGQVVHVSFCHISRKTDEDYFYNKFKDS